MKKLLIVSLLFSSYAMADNHFYAGGNVLAGYQTQTTTNGNSTDEHNDPGLSAFGGYNFAVHKNVDLGVELEYQYFGEANFSANKDFHGNAVYLNIRPKFISPGNNLYSALIAGAGVLNAKGKENNLSYSKTKPSGQLGIEVGYMLKQVDLSIGYRYRAFKIDNTNYAVRGLTAGMRYNF